MSNKLLTGALIAIVGGVTYKTIKILKERNKDENDIVNMVDTIEVDVHNEHGE